MIHFLTTVLIIR